VERDVKMPTVRKGAEEAASREERVCTKRGFLSQRWHANATVEIIIIATNHNLPYVFDFSSSAECTNPIVLILYESK